MALKHAYLQIMSELVEGLRLSGVEKVTLIRDRKTGITYPLHSVILVCARVCIDFWRADLLCPYDKEPQEDLPLCVSPVPTIPRLSSTPLVLP